MIKQPIENLRTSYKWYRQREIESPVLRDEYYQITQDFLQFIYNEVERGQSVELPNRTGYLYIEGNISKKITLIDWKSTMAAWKKYPEMAAKKEKIYHLNEHTGRVSYKFIWSKKDMYCMFKEVYHFTLSKVKRRQLRDVINSGKEYRIKQKYSNGNK